MKKMIVVLLALAVLCAFTTPAFAYEKGSHPSQDTSTYGHDAYGGLTRNDNMNKDSDGDGVSNYNDRNDRNSNVF